MKKLRDIFLLMLVSAILQFLTRSASGDIINGLENSPLTEVWAVKGGLALLPCDMDPPIKNDSTHLVLFYYSDAGTPIYSLDSRGSELENATHWADASVARRAFVRTNVGSRGLVLEGVSMEDAGDYRCRVDFLESPTRNSRIKLTVVVPPESLEISSNIDGGLSLEGRVGPYTIGTEVIFTCKAKGGTPRPQVNWWEGDKLLDNTTEVISGRVTGNDLYHPPLTRSDFNKTLTCLAMNSKLVDPLAISVNLDMYYPPTEVLIEGGVSRVTLKEGVPKGLTCQVIGSRPAAKVSWKGPGGESLPGHRGTVTEEVLQDGRTRSLLTYIPTLEDNGGSVECSASNPKLPKDVLKNKSVLDVLYKPRMILRPEEGIYMDDLREGDDVTLRCIVDANPEVKVIQWAHNGVPLQIPLLNNMYIDYDALVLKGITKGSSGNYTCAGANTEGGTTSKPLGIEVKFPPVCSSGQQKVFGAARHEQLLVQCTVESHPLPTSFRWAMNTSTGLVDIALSHSNSSGSTSTVRYTPQTHMDFGDLLCWANNDVDPQQMPCVFHVIPAAKPESVSDCVAERNSTMPASYVIISCAPGWGGGLNQSFTLEVRQQATEAVLEKFRLATEPTFIVNGLKIGVPYLLTVTPANSRGSGPPVTLSYTPPAVSADKVIFPYSETAILSLTPLLIVLVGVLLGVSVCVGVGVFFRKKRREGWEKDGEKIKMAYCSSLKDIRDTQDAPTIIRLTQDNDKEDVFKQSATMNSSQSSLYVNPAKLLNNRNLYSLESEAFLAKPLQLHPEKRAPLQSRESLEEWPSPAPVRKNLMMTSMATSMTTSMTSTSPNGFPPGLQQVPQPLHHQLHLHHQHPAESSCSLPLISNTSVPIPNAIPNAIPNTTTTTTNAVINGSAIPNPQRFLNGDYVQEDNYLPRSNYATKDNNVTVAGVRVPMANYPTRSDHLLKENYPLEGQKQMHQKEEEDEKEKEGREEGGEEEITRALLASPPDLLSHPPPHPSCPLSLHPHPHPNPHSNPYPNPHPRPLHPSWNPQGCRMQGVTISAESYL